MKKDWFKKSGFLLALLLGGFLSRPAHALTCGQVVTGTVTLTADLICQNTDGLVIRSSDVTINLNGHTIACKSGPGYQGSCQMPTNGMALGMSGILVAALGNPTPVLHNISVQGPGVITGFLYGTQVLAATGVTIQGVTYTGPPGPFVGGQGREYAAGITLNSIPCVDPPYGISANILANDISNQSQGMWLANASCVLVEDNYIHDNTSAHNAFYAYGMSVLGSSNTIRSNYIVGNGDNGYQGNTGLQTPGWDAGITIYGGEKNLVESNHVLGNCGDGISLLSGAADNVIDGNNIAGSSSQPVAGQCVTVSAGIFFDAASRQAGPNTWDTNNVCATKSSGIPAGVCQ